MICFDSVLVEVMLVNIIIDGRVLIWFVLT